MGPRSPSEFLEFLTATGGNIFPRNSILKIWYERLPPHISILIDSEINGQNETSVVKSNSRDRFSSRDRYSRSPRRFEGSSRARSASRERSSFRERFSSRDRSTTPEGSFPKNGLCFYHYTYRSQAHKCSKPCNWHDRKSPGSSSRRSAIDQRSKTPPPKNTFRRS